MTDVLEQMTQIYDLQVSSVYDRLERIDRNLFPNENRSIFLKDQQSFLSAMTDNSSEQILFMKESGQVMTTSGEEYYLDTQTSSLSKLQQNKPIAQSVTWNVDRSKAVSWWRLPVPPIPWMGSSSLPLAFCMTAAERLPCSGSG